MGLEDVASSQERTSSKPMTQITSRLSTALADRCNLENLGEAELR